MLKLPRTARIGACITPDVRSERLLDASLETARGDRFTTFYGYGVG